MKRLRPTRWSGQLLHAHPRAAAAARAPFIRCQSTASAPIQEDTFQHVQEIPRANLPSPSPERALRSAKLAALHARLALSNKIPLQTLARALISPTADSNANFNNQTLAQLGSTILNYHVMEYLVVKWPRLPMAILYEALRAYAGNESLSQIAKRWGVEAAAAPGEEVDPGLLQWSLEGGNVVSTRWGGYVRAETEIGAVYRRGISSRVVLDDDFGDITPRADEGAPLDHTQGENTAYMTFVQAVVGSIYAHTGREAAKAFIKSHILSRQVDLNKLFQFQLPTRELAMLCAREGFDAPLARLESETGRLSRTPVFVVGIYSGKEKLGEGAGPSLDVARRKACMVALKAWYLYTPSNKVSVPSDTMLEGAKPWKAPYIDIGEVI